MINAKKLYYTLLQDERITEYTENIFDAYPSTVETFPCVIFLEQSQSDIEFADNLPMANNLTVDIHIFTKALEDYPTTAELAIAINSVMQENFFVCRNNREVPDPDGDVRHRVLTFGKFIFS